jgi:hypothetical protein
MFATFPPVAIAKFRIEDLRDFALADQPLANPLVTRHGPAELLSKRLECVTEHPMSNIVQQRCA